MGSQNWGLRSFGLEVKLKAQDLGPACGMLGFLDFRYLLLDHKLSNGT